MSKNGIATTKEILFTFRISNENLSCVKNYSKNTEKGVLANLMFLDWYKQIYHQLYPYEDFAVGIEQFHMPRLSFVKMIIYYYKFRKRGYKILFFESERNETKTILS